MELALAGYAGFHTTTPPTVESSYGVYWPALVPAGVVDHVVVLPDGSRRVIAVPAAPVPVAPVPAVQVRAGGPTRRVPLGRVCAARSGDKGGNANVGVWTRD